MCFTRRSTSGQEVREVHNPRIHITCSVEFHAHTDRGSYGVGGGGCCGGGGGGGGNFSDDDNEIRITTGRDEDHNGVGAAESGGENIGDISGGGGNQNQGRGSAKNGGDQEIEETDGSIGGGVGGEKAEGGAYMSHTKPAGSGSAESSAAYIDESPRHAGKAYRYAPPPSAINYAAAPVKQQYRVVNSYVHSFGEGKNKGCTIM